MLVGGIPHSFLPIYILSTSTVLYYVSTITLCYLLANMWWE